MVRSDVLLSVNATLDGVETASTIEGRILAIGHVLRDAKVVVGKNCDASCLAAKT